jgi:hypothetical protein
MAQILDDNTVVPSFQGLRRRGVAEDTGNLSNLALRMGEVRDIVYPDDDRSISKAFIEYSVEVQHRDGRRPGTTSMYLGCTISNLFGGAADVFRYTLRKDDQSKESKEGVGVGSKVLLLCVNGQSTRAMIIGGLRDTKTNEEDVDDKEDGHNLYFEFNGISFTINKDGEATMAFRGPTKVDGDLDKDAGADDKNGPTTISILKNGNLYVYTKDEKQSILIDHENKKAAFVFDSEWDVKVSGKIALTADDNVTIKSKGVLIGDATDKMLLATTYRSAEQTLHNQLVAGLNQLSAAISSFATALGPTPAAPAAASLAPAVVGCTSMVSAIQSFEAQAQTYLSTKNKND